MKASELKAQAKADFLIEIESMKDCFITISTWNVPLTWGQLAVFKMIQFAIKTEYGAYFVVQNIPYAVSKEIFEAIVKGMQNPHLSYTFESYEL